MAKSVQVTCDCGHTFTMTEQPCPWDKSTLEFPVCDTECPKCHRRADGGNARTGEIGGWITQRALEASRREYEAQQFSADMNEWYGRGNW